VTNEELLTLVARDALRPRMQFVELAGDHVTFDAMTADSAYETVVVRELSRDDAVRVSVAGPRGGGKTSLIAHCCQRLPAEVIALRVPVVTMNDPGDPAVVADVAIAAALAAGRFDVHETDALNRARAEQITETRTDPSLRARIGGGVVPIELEGELASFGKDYVLRRQAFDRMQGLDRLVSMYLRRGLRPIFVIEDTEAMAGTPDSDELVTRFFARSLNAFARELDAGMVVAVQETFRENPAYRELVSGMREVRLPQLPDPAAGLAQILAHRLARAEIANQVEDIMNAAALDAFGAMYLDEHANLRRTLAAMSASVEHAADVGAERVEEHEARFGIQSGT
jgi:Cdc6-like AAA superfamily ATPase